MELNQLRYFQVAARQESMTKAAEELHISQSSLSKTIAMLEADMGVKLFDRTANRISLNAVGAQFLLRVDRLIRELEDAVTEASNADSGVVSYATDCSGLCADYLTQYIKTHPDARVRHTLMPAEQMRFALENSMVDFVLSFENLTSDSISWEPVIEDELLLLISKNHPLAQYDTLPLGSFRNDRFICNTSGFGLAELGAACCRGAGFSQQVLFEGSEPEIALHLVAANRGVMFMSALNYNWRMRMEVIDPPYQFIKAIHLTDPACVRTLGVSVLNNHYISATAKHFLAGALEALKQEAAEIG